MSNTRIPGSMGDPVYEVWTFDTVDYDHDGHHSITIPLDLPAILLTEQEHKDFLEGYHRTSRDGKAFLIRNLKQEDVDSNLIFQAVVEGIKIREQREKRSKDRLKSEEKRKQGKIERDRKKYESLRQKFEFTGED